MSQPKCPVSVKDLAHEVYLEGKYLKSHFTKKELMEPGDDNAGTDCRLRLHEGNWYLYTGSADYDQDHRGSWGASWVPWGCTRADARTIAEDLISQAMECYEEEGEESA